MWWIIFYGDGSTYDSRSDLVLAPTRDVQIIYQFDETLGQQCITDCHYYVWNSRWIGIETADSLWDYLWSDGWKRVLSGRMIAREVLNNISKIAHKYCRFSEKRNLAPWVVD